VVAEATGVELVVGATYMLVLEVDAVVGATTTLEELVVGAT